MLLADQGYDDTLRAWLTGPAAVTEAERVGLHPGRPAMRVRDLPVSPAAVRGWVEFLGPERIPGNLAGWPVRPGRRAPRPGTCAGSPARELEVMGLLFEGWTSARITAALVITPRTVAAQWGTPGPECCMTEPGIRPLDC